MKLYPTYNRDGRLVMVSIPEDECSTCNGSGEDPVGMPGEPCPECDGGR